jgi:hypothetical protein
MGTIGPEPDLPTSVRFCKEDAMKVLLRRRIWAEPTREPHHVWVKDGEVEIPVVGCNGPSSGTQTKPRVMALMPLNSNVRRRVVVRKLLAIAAVASVHAALSLGTFLIRFGHTMARFETGAPPTLVERVIDAAILILFFPVVHLARQAPHGWFSGLWGYVPFLLNSAICAVLIVNV